VIGIVEQWLADKAEDVTSKDLIKPLSALAEFYDSACRYRFEGAAKAAQFAKAVVSYQRVLATIEQHIADKVEGADSKSLIEPLTELAKLYVSEGNSSAAEDAYKHVVTILDKRPGNKVEDADEADLIAPLTALAALHETQGRYGESEAVLIRLMALEDKRLDAGDDALVDRKPFDSLVHLYEMLGRQDEARTLQRHVIEIQQKRLDALYGTSGNKKAVPALRSLAELFRHFGRYEEAESSYKRAIAALEADKSGGILGFAGRDLYETLPDLASLYEEVGRYGDAEAVRKRAMSVAEHGGKGGALLGKGDLMTSISNLARLYKMQGRYSEAETLLRRALATEEKETEKTKSKDGSYAPWLLQSIGELYESRGRDDDAERAYRKALAIKDSPNDRLSPQREANILIRLMFWYRAHGDGPKAAGVLARLLGIDAEMKKASNNSSMELVRGLVFQEVGRFAEAESAFNRAIDLLEKTKGVNHPDIATVRDEIALRYSEFGAHELALGYYRKAAAAFASGQAALTANSNAAAAVVHGAAVTAPDQSRRRRARGAGDRRLGYLYEQIASIDFATLIAPASRAQPDYFRHDVAGLAAVAGTQPERGVALGREAFESAQSATQSTAAAAIQQMASRFAAGGDKLASVIRESQDLAGLLRNRDKALAEALARPQGQRDRPAIDQIQSQMREIEQHLADAATRLEREFPGYSALANPRPLKIEDVQKYLGEEEGLVFLLTDESQSYVFAVTREAFDWKVIQLGAN
jgi:tetratricopeptide (TPR) repeat protein